MSRSLIIRTLAPALAFLAIACAKKEATQTVVPTENAERRDIVLTVEATGTLEPINVVEVKSKASGQIIKMPVEIGSVVHAGDLLVQIDTRDVKNAYDQAAAALAAAQARSAVAAAQRKRSDELVAGRVITAVEHETTVLDDANAQSALIKAATDLDLAKQRLEDATVRAPISGTVLAKPVSVGQVISSATSSVSGGTTLLQMADLSRVRMRTLVAETDVGRVHEGQEASVVVDAHSDRTLVGVVEKIEPQAVVQQSVTMFPVLVSIGNEEGLLMPGMNGEVTIQVDAHRDVVAVPVDAVQSVKNLESVAKSLGMNTDSLRTSMRGRAMPGGAMAASSPAGAEAGTRRGRRGGADSTSLRSGARGDSASGRWGARADSSAHRGGEAAGAASSSSSMGDSSGGTRAGRMQFVVVKGAAGYSVRRVRTGLSDYDYIEITNGLEAGEAVVLVSALELQQQRSETQTRIRQRVGTGVPGMTGGGTTRPGSGQRSSGGGR